MTLEIRFVKRNKYFSVTWMVRKEFKLSGTTKKIVLKDSNNHNTVCSKWPHGLVFTQAQRVRHEGDMATPSSSPSTHVSPTVNSSCLLSLMLLYLA